MTPEFQQEVEQEFEKQIDVIEKKVEENPKGFAREMEREADQHGGYAPGQYSPEMATGGDSIFFIIDYYSYYY